MNLHIPIQPLSTFTLPTPAQAVACASGQTGPYFFGNPLNQSIDVYMQQGDYLIAKHRAAYTQFYWYDDLETTREICGMAVSAGGHRLYVLFAAKFPNGLYKAWVTCYFWDGVQLKDSGFSFPIPGLTGVELTQPGIGEVLGLNSVLSYVAAHGFTGVSQWNAQLPDLLNITTYRGFLVVTYPIYFKSYPVAYTAVLVMSEKDATIQSAALLSGLSKWYEYPWVKPLAASVHVLDSTLVFRALRIGALSSDWAQGAFNQYSKFVDFTPCLKGDRNVWRQPYTLTGCSWDYIMGLHGSIIAPTLLNTTDIYTGSFIAGAGYTDSTLAGDNVHYIGLNGVDVQNYSVEYVVLEVLLHDVWVQYRNLDYKNLHPTDPSILQCRFRNTTLHTFIWNLTIETSSGLSIGTSIGNTNSTKLVLTELAPQDTYSFFACFSPNPQLPQMTVSYTPGI